MDDEEDDGNQDHQLPQNITNQVQDNLAGEMLDDQNEEN